MAGLLNLIPRYLPRYGMAPDWVAYQRPLVLVLLAIDVIVTLVFRASVTAQGGAYATGVLVLMLSAAVAVTVSLWREASLKEPRLYLLCFYFFLVALVFLYTTIANMIERPDGAIIASIFIFLLLTASASAASCGPPRCVFRKRASSIANRRSYGTPSRTKRSISFPTISPPGAPNLLAAKVREHYKVRVLWRFCMST